MATQINNTASATYTYGRNIRDSATSNTTSTLLIKEFAISAYKSSLNTSFRSGENITYYIVISNDGTGTLYNVTISDDLGGAGALLAYVDSSATVNINGTITSITPTTATPLSFVLPSPLTAGEKATISFIARVNSTISDSVTTITNTATIQANSGSASGSVVSVSPSPTYTLQAQEYANITMSKTASTNQITIGESFNYIITLVNNGSLDATGVVISDTLPTNFEISSITSLTNGVQTTFDSSDYTLESSTNTLTLPNVSSSKSITVPGATTSGNGVTVVTITGSITS